MRKNNKLSFYLEYLLQLSILEVLVLNGNINLLNLAPIVIDRIKNKTIALWSLKISDIDTVVAYLHKLELLSINDSYICINERGIEALRSGVIHNMVTTAFFNYSTLRVASFAFYISVVAAIISFFTLIHELLK